MKKRILNILIVFALVSVLLGGLPAEPVRADVTAVTIDFWPSAIPDDGTTADCTTTASTPFAVRVSVTGAASDFFIVGFNIGSEACTWNPSIPGWTINPPNFPGGQLDQNGIGEIWIYGRMLLAGTGTGSSLMRVSAFTCPDGTFTGCHDPFEAQMGITRLDMSGTGDGGWLEETVGIDRDGLIVAVTDVSDDQSVALYPAEVNGITEGVGFPQTDSYFKVGVPACTNCDLIIEIWDPLFPGIPLADRHVNVLSDIAGPPPLADTCPAVNDVTAGGTTSLDGCNIPTAITLKSFTGTTDGGISILLAALALAIIGFGLALFFRRRKASW